MPLIKTNEAAWYFLLNVGGENLHGEMRQHRNFAVGKFPKRKSSSAGSFCLQGLACLGIAGREVGGGNWGLVLAASSLCKPPTVKGVKLLRCCSLVACK